MRWALDDLSVRRRPAAPRTGRTPGSENAWQALQHIPRFTATPPPPSPPTPLICHPAPDSVRLGATYSDRRRPAPPEWNTTGPPVGPTRHRAHLRADRLLGLWARVPAECSPNPARTLPYTAAPTLGYTEPAAMHNGGKDHYNVKFAVVGYGEEYGSPGADPGPRVPRFGGAERRLRDTRCGRQGGTAGAAGHPRAWTNWT